jgi:hypothetical protein
VLALVRRARRRILHNHLFSEGSNAASAALAAFLLLLILGTQVLNWYWAVLLPAAAIVFAAWRIRRRMPSLYVTAQRVDRRMGLADALSTAWFFSGSGSSRGSAELRSLQLQQAEQAATQVDPRAAVPYFVPRTAYIAAALLLIASSVLALRYALSDRLDLRQPLARIIEQRLGYPEPSQRAKLDPRREKNQFPQDDAQGDQGQPTDPADAGPPPDDLAESAADQGQPQAAKSDRNAKNSQSDDANEDGEADQSEQPQDNPQNASNPKNGQKEGRDSQQGNPQQSQGSQNLFSKMKEAMQNLLSSMQQNQQNQQQQSGSNQNGKGSKGQQSASKQQNKGEKNNSQSGDAQDQQAADGQEAQNSQSQSSERQDSPMANKQPGSGAGNRDGAKDVRQAEQLAAMGKISEIIGKRAANLTGEATIDVQNTSQQLRTSYQEKSAEHSQAGAEINRDEIPVALENYVEQYFEQVRKQPAPKK